MKKALILAAAACTLVTATAVHADIFQYEGTIIAGDSENTYVYDSRKEEEQTQEIFYYPPDGNFCVHDNKLYFDADEQLVEYSFDTGECSRIGSAGGGFTVETHFAGVLDERLYFTVFDGYTEDSCSLKYLDFSDGEIHDYIPGVYGACVWDNTLFLMMELPDENDPDKKQVCIGWVPEGSTKMTIHSREAACPEKPSGRLIWAGEDAVYFPEYYIDQNTGERSCILLRKILKDPETGSCYSEAYGQINDPDSQPEYLGTAGGRLFIRVHDPENESENFVAVQDLSDDSVATVFFSGKTSGQNDSDLYFSDSAAYYMAEDSSLWQLEFSESEDHLIGRFPQETEIQGITETDVYFVSAGTLYTTPLSELTADAKAQEEPVQDPAVLINELEEGLQKTAEICTPSPYIWPEILKNNPNLETWLNEASGKKLRASVSLDSGIEISASKEDKTVSLHFKADGSEEEFQFEIPEILYSGDLFTGSKARLEDFIDVSTITGEDGSMIPLDAFPNEKNEIPCRILHATVSWQKVEEMMQDVMSRLSGLFEDLSVSTDSIPDISGQIASLQDQAGDGILLDFYITEEGCVRFETFILKSPRVIGALGSVPELKRIAEGDNTPGIRFTADLLQDQSTWAQSKTQKPEMDVMISMITEISSGHYPDRNYATLSMRQHMMEEVFTETISIPLSFGSMDNSGRMSLMYSPEHNKVSVSFYSDRQPDGLDISLTAPEISGSRLLLPFAAFGKSPLSGESFKTEGNLVLEYSN